MAVYRTNTDPFLGFDKKFNQNYFAVVGDFFKADSCTRNIFMDVKNESTTMFVSVPSIELIAMDLNPLSANPTKWSNTLKQTECE